MKKHTIIIATVLFSIVMLSACNKENVKIADENSSELKYTVSYANSMDYLGQHHNAAMLYALNYMDSIPIDTSEIIDLVEDYMATQTGVSWPNMPLTHSSQCSAYIENVKSAMNASSYSNLNNLDYSLYQIDQLASANLSTSERNVIYAMTSIARHSARMWAPSEFGGYDIWEELHPSFEGRPLTNEEWLGTMVWDAIGMTLGVTWSGGSMTPGNGASATWKPSFATGAGASLYAFLAIWVE